MAHVVVEIVWASSALESLRALGSRETQRKIVAKVENLRSTDRPEMLGKPMVDELQGLLRLSYARFRILYQVDRPRHVSQPVRVVVQVILVGIRKEGHKQDIYRIAQRLRARGEI